MNSIAQKAASRPLSPVSTPPARASGSWVPATTLLKAYAWYRGRVLDNGDATVAQQRQLAGLVGKAAKTRFGRDHDFARIRTVADFQSRVPLRRYNQLWDGYWKADFPRVVDATWPGVMPYFAVSSGTSSGSVKYIPCSREMVSSNKRAALEILVHHIRNRPNTRIFDSKCFLLGGSTDLVEQAPGILSGDISGIAAHTRPWWVEDLYFPPRSLTFVTDWEEKIDRMAPASLREDIRFLSGAPGWQLILFEKLAALKPETAGRIVDFYPNLELLVHGGVSFAPYRERFERLLEGSRAETREVYPASEGFIAIADRGPGQGLRVLADNGIFFEFVPVEELDRPNPTRHWLATVETGVDYAIVLNTNAGLWGYVIGDVVRFVDRAPPRLVITGRTSYMLSPFGEHLTGDLVETAVLTAAKRIGVEVSEFAVGTAFGGPGGALGHHVYVVELAEPVDDAARTTALATAIDDELQARNEDYQERRAIELGVRAPEVHIVVAGTFAGWMKSIGRLGGQNKVPRVISDANVFRGLLDYLARPAS